MREHVRQRHQAVLLVGQAVEAGALTGDGESRPGRDEVVRRQLKLVGDRQPEDVVSRAQEAAVRSGTRRCLRPSTLSGTSPAPVVAVVMTTPVSTSTIAT